MGGGSDRTAWRTGLVLALPGSTYSRKANARVQLKGIGWPPRVRDTAQSYLRLVHWALLEFMEPYGLKNTLYLLLHLLSPFVFRVSVPDNLVVGRTHTIVRLQTRIRRKDGTENFGGFVYVLDRFPQRDFGLWFFMCPGGRDYRTIPKFQIFFT